MKALRHTHTHTHRQEEMILIQLELHCEQISPTPHEYSFSDVSQFPLSFGSWRWEGHSDIVFSGCLCCNVRNKSHDTCRKWQFWFLKAVKSEKRSCLRLFMMPCSSGQLSFFWTCHTEMPGGWSVKLRVKKLLTFTNEISYILLVGNEITESKWRHWYCFSELFFFSWEKHQTKENRDQSNLT